MMNENINPYFGNPTSHSDVTLLEKREDILKFICRKGVIFTTEAAKETGLSMYEVNQIMFNLHKLGYIEKIYPDPESPQSEFKGRMGELWKMGIIGYPSFSQYSWWTITYPGIEYIKAVYRGKGMYIKGSLLSKANPNLEESQEKNKKEVTLL